MEPPWEGGVWARDYAVPCCLPADFGLPFGRELGVVLSLSPTLSMLLASNTLCTFSLADTIDDKGTNLKRGPRASGSLQLDFSEA